LTLPATFGLAQRAGRARLARMTQIVAWSILILGFALPLLHVLLSPRGGPWRAHEGARCPLSPRLGWLVIVLFLGPLGWLLYLRGTSRAA
jgi:hypothetical protein